MRSLSYATTMTTVGWRKLYHSQAPDVMKFCYNKNKYLISVSLGIGYFFFIYNAMCLWYHFPPKYLVILIEISPKFQLFDFCSWFFFKFLEIMSNNIWPIFETVIHGYLNRIKLCPFKFISSLIKKENKNTCI